MNMSRRASDFIATLTAGVLILSGQCILITPEFMGSLELGIPSNIALGLGLAFFVSGLLLIATVVFGQFNWKIYAVYFLGALALAGLGFLYWQGRLYLEIPLFLALIISLPAGTRLQDSPLAQKRFLTAFAATVNLATGILILASRNLSILDQYPELTRSAIWLGSLFLATALACATSAFLPDSKWSRVPCKLTAFPWLIWTLLHTATQSWTNLIPALCLSASLLLMDSIPWARLKLPDDDILGRRLLWFTAIVQTAFLTGFSLLLNIVGELTNHVQGTAFLTGRNLTFLLFILTEGLLGYALLSALVAIHELTRVHSDEENRDTGLVMDPELEGLEARIARLIRPFVSSRLDRENRTSLLVQQLNSVNKQLEAEKRRNSQLLLLTELSQQLETQLDAPVAAQLAVSTLQRSIQCSFTALYVNDPERRELVVLSVAGTRMNILPPGYRQPIHQGILGRAVRQRKTQMVPDCRQDPDFIQIEGEDTLSLVAVPLIDHGHMKGVLEISDSRPNAFSGHDIQIAESVAVELLKSWDRSEYHQRLTELIQAGISLTTQPDPQAAVQEVANIARQTLRARFTFVTLLDQEGNFTRVASAGHAPRLLKSISHLANREPLVQAALNAGHPFRIRDVRKYKRASQLEIDFVGLRSLIAVPIRMHSLSVGAILAFGKQGEVFFTENDESLARLLSSQSSAAIESAWLSHELRASFSTTTQLYQLSFHVIQAEDLNSAARYIAETALHLCGAENAGIVLFTPDKQIEAEAQLDAQGMPMEPDHPMDLIWRTLETKESDFLATGSETDCICFPLKTLQRTYGALWLTIAGPGNSRYMSNLQTLANQAAVALEHSILLVESRQQAKALEQAYKELEEAYDHTLAALMSSLDARDRETEGHSVRVSQFARQLGEKLHLSAQQLKALERGSLLHDIGKIGISDSILHKPGPLDPTQWRIMRQHPDIGARIVEGIPFLQDTLPIIRYHQERWDGSGYPVGLSGKDIPLLARIFAVADAFDALTSDRPYRQRISAEEALQYLKENAGGSEKGRHYAAKHCDVAFVILEAHDFDYLKKRVDHYRAFAREEYGRELLIWTYAYVVQGDTEAAAKAYFDDYVNKKGDRAAVDNLVETMGMNAQTLPPEALQAIKIHFMAGWGGFPLIGTKEQVVEGLAMLAKAGFDGVLLSWPRYIADMRHFRQHIYPLLEQAGLR